MSPFLLLLAIYCVHVYSIKVNIDGYHSQSVDSLSGALEVIENVGSLSTQRQTTVYVDGGVHEPIALNNKHNNIKFIAANNTLINGGYTIKSEWSKQSNGYIWSTSIDLLSNYSKPETTFNFPKQFWINDQRRPATQTPVLYWESAISNKGIVYKKGDISSDWNLLAPGVFVVVFAQWTVSLHQVKYHNPDNQTIIFMQPASNDIDQYETASKKEILYSRYS